MLFAALSPVSQRIFGVGLIPKEPSAGTHPLTRDLRHSADAQFHHRAGPGIFVDGLFHQFSVDPDLFCLL